MPDVVTVVDPASIIGLSHPDVTRDANSRIATETVHTPLFEYTATFTRQPNYPYDIVRVDITVADAP